MKHKPSDGWLPEDPLVSMTMIAHGLRIMSDRRHAWARGAEAAALRITWHTQGTLLSVRDALMASGVRWWVKLDVARWLAAIGTSDAGEGAAMSEAKMQKQKIKPCPWCGKQPSIAKPYNGHYWVQCERGLVCHYVQGPERKSEAAAIKAWNERRK